MAEQVAALTVNERDELFADFTELELEALEYDWSFWGRPKQQTPAGDWTFWFIKSGRGFGKTRTAAEWVRSEVDNCEHWLFVGPTPRDVRDLMIEGESGIQNVFPRHQRPKYEPAKLKLTFHNGAVATIRSAHDYDSLRGPQFGGFWAEEVGTWDYPKLTWDNLMFGFRLAGLSRGIITSTPTPTWIVRYLLGKVRDLPPPTGVHVTEGSSYENRANLSEVYYETVIRPYEGTRVGRQEIHGEFLETREGTLWTLARIDAVRVAPDDVPDLVRVVVAVDPSGGGDEIGIVAAGLGTDGEFYVLEDGSLRASPAKWAAEACRIYHEREADRVVGERNFGGDMVESTIRSVPEGAIVAYSDVHASRGKAVRAEPIAALYEKGLVHHVGTFPDLEGEMSNWVQGDKDSPNRMDALVWAITELKGGPGQGLWM